ncbi:MAG: hypothetical protein F7C35_00795 [Desulfurococcales archaeon]|nr:hypothetical protein [Desulfurococcales archaeon]
MGMDDLENLRDEAGGALVDTGNILIEIGRRAVSAVVGLQAGPAAGAAVGVALAAAYLIYRRRKKLASKGLTVEQAEIVKLTAMLDDLYKRREELSKALQYAKRPVQRRMLMNSIQNTDSLIEDLEALLELENTLLEAKKRIRTLLGPKAAREVEKILSRVEKGEEPVEGVYKLLSKVGEKVERTERGIETLRLLLGGPLT